MFESLFDPEMKLATSIDAYLDRLEKIMRIRGMLKEQGVKTKEWDEAINSILSHMTAAVDEAKAAKEAAKEKTENKADATS